MKTLLIAAMLLAPFSALFAAGDSTDLRHIKRLTFGARFRGANMREVNSMLRAAGCPEVPVVHFGLSVTQATYFPQRWGFWYNVNYGTAAIGKGDRNLVSQVFEGAAGMGYMLVAHRPVAVRVLAGCYLGGWNAKLYNAKADTVSFSNYVTAQPADTKHFGGGQAGAVIGLDVQTHGLPPDLFTLGAGYCIPFGRSVVGRRGVQRNDAPAANISTWYGQISFSIQWNRYWPVCKTRESTLL